MTRAQAAKLLDARFSGGGNASCTATACAAGSAAPAGTAHPTAACAPCAAGCFSPGGAAGCANMSCPLGWFTQRLGSAGPRDGCTPCAAGLFSDTLQATNASACRSCPLGSFAYGANSTQCFVCAAGSFVTNPADPGGSCEPCPLALQAACTGGRTCAEGYSPASPFCAACVKADRAAGVPGYYKQGDACVPCTTQWLPLLILALVVGGVAAFFFYAGLNRGLLMRVKLSSGLVQTVALVLMVKVAWPEGAAQVREVLDRLTASIDVANPECLGEWSWHSKFGASFGALAAVLSAMFALDRWWLRQRGLLMARFDRLDAAAGAALNDAEVEAAFRAPYRQYRENGAALRSIGVMLISVAYPSAVRLLLTAFDCM
jgi:hypothetical protein